MRNLLSKVFLFIAVAILTLIQDAALAQGMQADLQHLDPHSNFEQLDIEQKTEVKWHQAINPLYWIYKGSIGFYQKNISVQIAANCVYETTCSRFSRELTDEFGVLGGVFLSIERLSRCNRVSIVETSPLELNKEGKIVEKIEDYHFH